MNILIKEATKIDYFEINKMLLELQNYHSENIPTIYKKMDNFFTNNEYLEILKDKNIFFLLALLDRKVVGFIWLRLNKRENKFEYERKQIWIEAIYIKPNARNKGIAKILLNEAIYKAKILEVTSIELMIWNFNELSKKFFQKYFKTRALIMSMDI